MKTECEEVANSMKMPAEGFACFSDACDYVRARMPGESETVIDNTATALYRSWLEGEHARAALSIKCAAVSRAFEEFFNGYLVCALWSSNDNADDGDGQPLDHNYDVDDISIESTNKMRAEALQFFNDNAADLGLYAGHPVMLSACDRKQRKRNPWAWAGHDLWLTRNGHGAGYWDRGLGELGDRLTAAARLLGQRDMYIGDNCEVWQL